MFIASVGKRICMFISSSGRNWLRDFDPVAGKYGSVNTPGAPRRGKEVMVMGASLPARCCFASLLLEITYIIINCIFEF